jgi:hypothetical protein
MVSGVAVAAGLQPASTRPGWRRLKHPDGYATSFWVSPQDITSETLDRLWLPDTDATVVTIRLTAVADGRTEVSAWVHYHSGERLGKDVSAGLNLLTGRQLAAVHTDRGGSLLVGADLGIGQAGVIVDHGVHERNSDSRLIPMVAFTGAMCGLASVASALLTGHELMTPAVGDVSEFSDIDVDQ